MVLAVLADVMDHIEFESGIRAGGLTMSIYSSITAAAQEEGKAIAERKK